MDQTQQSNQTEQSKIQVSVRIRPKLESEQFRGDADIQIIDNKTLCIQSSGVTTESTYNRVFTSTTTQEEVFTELKEKILGLFNGYNCTIFAYGQTGSGKTYTIYGDDIQNLKSSELTDSCGIIPRTINLIYDKFQSTAIRRYNLLMSMFQIYNEKIYDLLDDQCLLMNPLEIRQIKSENGVQIVGISEYDIKSRKDMIKLLKIGDNHRIKRQTKMNLASSRSHTIFRVLVESNEPINGQYIRAQLNICDLAGSEKWHKGKVMSALSKDEQFIPYRDSKLTRILQGCLGGNNNTHLIATISPLEAWISESQSSLKFADRAKQVNTLVKQNTVNIQENQQIQRLQKEIQALNEIIKKSGKGQAEVRDLQLQIMRLTEENQKLKEQQEKIDLSRLIEENNKLREFAFKAENSPEQKLIIVQQQNEQEEIPISNKINNITHTSSNSSNSVIDSPHLINTTNSFINDFIQTSEDYNKGNNTQNDLFNDYSEAQKQSQIEINQLSCSIDSSFQQIQYSFINKIEQKYNGDHINNINTKVDSDAKTLQVKYQKAGRCGICTLPVPCKHTNDTITTTTNTNTKTNIPQIQQQQQQQQYVYSPKNQKQQQQLFMNTQKNTLIIPEVISPNFQDQPSLKTSNQLTPPKINKIYNNNTNNNKRVKTPQKNQDQVLDNITDYDNISTNQTSKMSINLIKIETSSNSSDLIMLSPHGSTTQKQINQKQNLTQPLYIKAGGQENLLHKIHQNTLSKTPEKIIVSHPKNTEHFPNSLVVDARGLVISPLRESPNQKYSENKYYLQHNNNDLYNKKILKSTNVISKTPLRERTGQPHFQDKLVENQQASRKDILILNNDNPLKQQLALSPPRNQSFSNEMRQHHKYHNFYHLQQKYR